MRWAMVFAVAVIGVLAAGYAFAQGFKGWNNTGLREIMQSGTYEDLVQYREESGFSMMPWVDDAEDFELAKQMHQRMFAWRDANPDALAGRGGCHGYRYSGG